MQVRTSTASIGPSALRNQGVGILEKAQKYCSEIDLSEYSLLTECKFLSHLDRETDRLMISFNNDAWGTARKALNLFFRDALYNKYLSEIYNLDAIESFLEIPLDRAVSTGLKRRGVRGELPQWPGLKSLRKEISDEYQSFALKEAVKEGISRVHIDMYLWLEYR